MLDWEKSKEKDKNTYLIPNKWLLIHYYEALTILFRIENVLRLFVYIVLKNKYLDQWENQHTTSDDNDQGTILSIAKKRINQAKDFGYLGYTISCPIMHLTSGELARLISSDTNWPLFNSHFAGNKEVMKNKLGEIGVIRNSLAHFRPIKTDDIELLKQNSKHVLIKIDQYVTGMLSCKSIVPTNTEDNWYLKLRELEDSNSYSLSFSQSTDGVWIKFIITYNCDIIKSDIDDDWCRYSVLNINSSQVLKESRTLSRFITFMFEDISYPRMPENRKPNFRKSLEIIFRKDILSEHYEVIKQEIGKILKLIESETSLIKADNLARGKIICVAHPWANLEDVDIGEGKAEQYWSFKIQSLETPTKENDVPEYWGNHPTFYSNFISDVHIYPWMSVEISKEDFPF